MKKIIGSVIGVVALGAVLLTVFPSLRGPFNRVRNNVNSSLDKEYVVDNYKAEYIRLHKQGVELRKNLEHFKAEMRVVQKKLDMANTEQKTITQKLKETGTADLKAFQILRDKYEVTKIDIENNKKLIETYKAAVAKLESGIALVESNMSRAKLNVATLESKKRLVDSIKTVNDTVSNINGIGDEQLAINTEKLDEDEIRESVRLESFQMENAKPLSKTEAEEFIKTLK